jgi:hypothetical protein
MDSYMDRYPTYYTNRLMYKTDEDDIKDNEFINFVVNGMRVTGMKKGNDIDDFIREQFQKNKSFRDKFSETYYKYESDKNYNFEISERIKSKLKNKPKQEHEYSRNFMHLQSSLSPDYNYGGTRRKRRSKKAKKTRRHRKKRA